MYLQTRIRIKTEREKNYFCWRLENHCRKEQDPHPDPNPHPLVTSTDPRIRIRIRTKNVMDPERCLQ